MAGLTGKFAVWAVVAIAALSIGHFSATMLSTHVMSPAAAARQESAPQGHRNPTPDVQKGSKAEAEQVAQMKLISKRNEESIKALQLHFSKSSKSVVTAPKDAVPKEATSKNVVGNPQRIPLKERESDYTVIQDTHTDPKWYSKRFPMPTPLVDLPNASPLSLPMTDMAIFGSAHQCMTNKRKDGKIAVLKMCEHTDEQLWTFGEDGTIMSSKTGTCLDAEKSTMDNDEALLLQKCDATSKYQQWEFLKDNEYRPGWGLLRNVGSQTCIDMDRDEQLYFYTRVRKCRPKCAQTVALVSKGSQAPNEHHKIVHERSKPEPPIKGLRIYCWVLTYPKFTSFRAVAVNDTWARWCDKIVYMSSDTFPGLNMVALNLSRPESRIVVWEKTRLSWLYAYDNHLDEYDWFMKADDDTFANLDNLRDFLSTKNPKEPHWFGRWLIECKEKPRCYNDYYSGGSGYLLSQKALRIVGDNKKTHFMGDKHPDEDTEMGRRMHRLNMTTEDTRDEKGRERWLPIGIDAIRQSRRYTRARTPTLWYWERSRYPPGELEECCSTKWVATHYIAPTLMRELYYGHLNFCEGSGLDDHY